MKNANLTKFSYTGCLMSNSHIWAMINCCESWQTTELWHTPPFDIIRQLQFSPCWYFHRMINALPAEWPELLSWSCVQFSLHFVFLHFSMDSYNMQLQTFGPIRYIFTQLAFKFLILDMYRWNMPLEGLCPTCCIFT